MGGQQAIDDGTSHCNPTWHCVAYFSAYLPRAHTHIHTPQAYLPRAHTHVHTSYPDGWYGLVRQPSTPPAANQHVVTAVEEEAVGEEVKPREGGAAEEAEAAVETAAQDADVAVEGRAGSNSVAGDAGQVDLRQVVRTSSMHKTNKELKECRKGWGDGGQGGLECNSGLDSSTVPDDRQRWQ